MLTYIDRLAKKQAIFHSNTSILCIPASIRLKGPPSSPRFCEGCNDTIPLYGWTTSLVKRTRIPCVTVLVITLNLDYAINSEPHLPTSYCLTAYDILVSSFERGS